MCSGAVQTGLTAGLRGGSVSLTGQGGQWENAQQADSPEATESRVEMENASERFRKLIGES